MKRPRGAKGRIRTDILCILFATAVAAWLGYQDVLSGLLALAPSFSILAIFIIGSFFTSVFTVPFAVIGLGQLALMFPVWQVVLIGGLGATAGDYLLFRFAKDRIAADLGYLLKRSTRYQLFVHMISKKKFRYMALLFAMVLVASPLPDETALTMLGVAKAKNSDVAKLVFVANCIGIFLIAIAARASSY